MTTRQMNMKHKWKIKSNVRVLVVNVHFMIDIIKCELWPGIRVARFENGEPSQSHFPQHNNIFKKVGQMDGNCPNLATLPAISILADNGCD
uniref:Uncharacterized protein n=1 Tax=Anguilla anguilla TaxID=7936 RepID=A0A0E9PWH5_ANGAN